MTRAWAVLGQLALLRGEEMAYTQQTETKLTYLTSDGIQFKAASAAEVVAILWNKARYMGSIQEYMANTSRACTVVKSGCEVAYDTPESFVRDLIVWGFLARVSW